MGIFNFYNVTQKGDTLKFILCYNAYNMVKE